MEVEQAYINRLIQRAKSVDTSGAEVIISGNGSEKFVQALKGLIGYIEALELLFEFHQESKKL